MQLDLRFKVSAEALSLRACIEYELIQQSNPLILTKPYGGGIYASPLPPSTAPARSAAGSRAGVGGPPDPYKTNEKATFSL